MAQRLTGRFAGELMAAPNLTPLVPVLLVLLAVFAAGVGAATPKASSELQIPPALSPVDWFSLTEEAHVSIQDGRFFLRGELFQKDELPARLRAIAQGEGAAEGLSHRRIRVRADADVPYAVFAGVVKAAEEAGLDVMLVNEDVH